MAPLLAGLLTLFLAFPAPAQQDERERKVGRGLNFFSEKEEVAMGARHSDELNGKLELVTDPAVTGYVNELGQRLARVSLRPDIQYRFFVVNTREANAFALPGGFIYVNRGLIDILENESELAAVIGHEIGHVAGRHATKQMSKKLLLTGIVLGGSVAAGSKSKKWGDLIGAIGGAGVFFASLKYSRNDERQSDWLGMQELVKAGLDPDGMVSLFRKFDALSRRGGGGPGLALLSTHPLPSERAANMQKEIAALHDAIPRPAASPGFDRTRAVLAALPMPPPGKDRTLTSALASLERGTVTSPAAGQRGAREVKLVVPGNSVWVDTGVDLAQGEYFAVLAEGQVFWKKNSEEWCDPGGVPGTGGKGFLKPITRALTGALVGKIGKDSAKAFYIGAEAGIEAPEAGRLFLGINDDNNFDNRGRFEATIYCSQ